MDIKFKLVRHGTGSGDAGPNSEVGFVISGCEAVMKDGKLTEKEGGLNTAITVHCPGTDHAECGKACAQKLLDADCIQTGTKQVDDGVDAEGNPKTREEAVMTSPRKFITKALEDRTTALKAEAEKTKAHKVAELPKVERTEKRDGKNVKVMVEDRDLT